jgi:hypothetical protein
MREQNDGLREVFPQPVQPWTCRLDVSPLFLEVHQKAEGGAITAVPLVIGDA